MRIVSFKPVNYWNSQDFGSSQNATLLKEYGYSSSSLSKEIVNIAINLVLLMIPVSMFFTASILLFKKWPGSKLFKAFYNWSKRLLYTFPIRISYIYLFDILIMSVYQF